MARGWPKRSVCPTWMVWFHGHFHREVCCEQPFMAPSFTRKIILNRGLHPTVATFWSAVLERPRDEGSSELFASIGATDGERRDPPLSQPGRCP